MIPEKPPTQNTGHLAQPVPTLICHHFSQVHLFPRQQACVWSSAIHPDPHKTFGIQWTINKYLLIEVSTQYINCQGQGMPINTAKVLRILQELGISYLFVLIAFHSKIIFNHNISVLPFPDVFSKLGELSFIQNSSWFQGGLKRR